MPERIKDVQIKRLVERMQKRGMDVALDSSYNRFAVTNTAGSRTLSPRGPNRLIYDWLFAFEAGWEAGRESVIDMIRQGDPAIRSMVSGED